MESALNKYECTRDQLTSVYQDAERIILKRFFQDEYSQNLKMYDLANHIEHMAEQYALQDVEVYKKCMPGLKNFSYQYSALINGEKGEWRARRTLNRLSIPHEILQGIELEVEGEPNEYDDIVITSKGVFIIEVKYSKTDTLIDKNGNYKSKGKRPFGSYNLGEKMQSKCYVLWKTITPAVKEYLTRDRIYSVLLYVNNESSVENLYPYIDICHCSDINYYLEDFNRDVADLSDEQMIEIKNVIRAANTESEYKIDLDFNELNSDLIEMTKLIEAAARSSNEVKQGCEEVRAPEHTVQMQWKFDWKSAIIGSFIGIIGGCAIKRCCTMLKNTSFRRCI